MTRINDRQHVAMSYQDHDCDVRVSLSSVCSVHAIDRVSWTYGILCVLGELVGQSILQTMMFHAKGEAFGLRMSRV